MQEVRDARGIASYYGKRDVGHGGEEDGLAVGMDLGQEKGENHYLRSSVTSRGDT